MAESSLVHNTFVIERTYSKVPSRVFAAFADANQKKKWFAESASQTMEGYSLDFQVGGYERSHSRFKEGTPFPGVEMIYEGLFQNIVLDQRIVAASTMTIGKHCISASLLTFEFLPIEKGTLLRFTHQAVFFEHSDGPQMREHGWQELLNKLEKSLV